ncbi:uncharacterized protein EV422DRAFT_509327 [Fimicolochytrium jonesii]|uniref:uncharacterized protein n=1 Tax=Fimicolochytrium jonesii TaxID=1396493 RepID=UPI0022FEF758|nr:uncharacterized protein EV422DRAFT_509327 [Fimicolochytrium jonesii]KAI8816900.1 hypothetical protein EV422DRAFT_509327 [Fimicolochytrium jonesii]
MAALCDSRKDISRTAYADHFPSATLWEHHFRCSVFAHMHGSGDPNEDPAREGEPQAMLATELAEIEASLGIFDGTPLADSQNEDQAKDGRDPRVSDEDWAELEEAKLADAEKMERIRREMGKQALQAEIRKAQAVQERIRRICPCPAGFNWYKTLRLALWGWHSFCQRSGVAGNVHGVGSLYSRV